MKRPTLDGFASRHSRIAISTALMAISSVSIVPELAAAEQLDILNCRSGTVTPLHADKDLTVNTVELKGVTMSRNANKALDNSSSVCTGTVRIGSGDNASHGFCKYMDKDGDVVVLEWGGKPPSGGSWTFLNGTGKWAGVQGGGAWQTMPSPKPIAPGTVQSCNIATGEYTLRK
jgi:hypothetical protein